MPLPPSLPPYCTALLDKVEATSGYSLTIEEAEALEFDSVLQLASASRMAHVLTYRSAYRQYLEHFVVSACYKVLRTWDEPKAERYVPASEVGRQLPEALHAELLSKLPLQLHHQGNAFSALLCGGLVRQLTSFPTDLRVEQDIHQSILQHKAKQHSYLETQVRDFLPTLDEAMVNVFPKQVYRATTAMNIAFAESAAELAQVVPDQLIRRHSSRKSAEELLHLLKTIADPGARGDRLLTDAWARELKLEGWYEWMPWQAP